MLATANKTGRSVDKFLLYHFLLVTGIALLVTPLITQDKTFGLTLLVSLQIALTCISTLIGFNMGHRLDRGAATLLFSVWMLVWLVHLI